MRFKNILVPYDGSEHADRALDVAGDFLRSNPEARVHVISVTYVALDAADFNPDPPNEDEQYNLLGYEMYEEVSRHRARTCYLRHDHSPFSSRGHRRLRTPQEVRSHRYGSSWSWWSSPVRRQRYQRSAPSRRPARHDHQIASAKKHHALTRRSSKERLFFSPSLLTKKGCRSVSTSFSPYINLFTPSHNRSIGCLY